MYLLFDGGNGGPNKNQGYGSFIIAYAKESPPIHHERVEFENPMTNNEAEYNTLIYALRTFYNMFPTATHVIIEGDSDLVRCQVLGLWQVKELRLKPLRDKAQELIHRFVYTYNHVPRSYVVEKLGH